MLTRSGIASQMSPTSGVSKPPGSTTRGLAGRDQCAGILPPGPVGSGTSPAHGERTAVGRRSHRRSRARHRVVVRHRRSLGRGTDPRGRERRGWSRGPPASGHGRHLRSVCQAPLNSGLTIRRVVAVPHPFQNGERIRRRQAGQHGRCNAAHHQSGCRATSGLQRPASSQPSPAHARRPTLAATTATSTAGASEYEFQVSSTAAAIMRDPRPRPRSAGSAMR